MFATLFIPSFHLQAALRHEPATLREQPLAMVDETEKPARIIEFTKAARQAGLRAGMTSTQGLARCPALEIRYRSPARERIAMDAVLQCAACASPCIEATGPGICTMDWKGLGSGAFEKTAETLIAQLHRQELIAKIGIAATPGLALLAARNAKRTKPILHVTRIEQLDALPISALVPALTSIRQKAVSKATVVASKATVVARLGIRRLGQFRELPPDGIASRFGPEMLECWECIAGKSTRLLELVSPPERFEEEMEFENEIELLEPLLFMLRRFIECIAERLAAAYLAAAVLELNIGFTAGPDYTHPFPIPSPTRDVETLFRMLFTHLESFQSPHPIKSLRLTAIPCKPVKEQLGLFETSLRDPNRFHQTLSRLCALVGADRAGVPVKENTFMPDSFKLHPPSFPAPAIPSRVLRPCGLALRRFRPPRPAHVFTVDQRPASLVVEGFSAPLGESSGPWVTSGQWWERDAWERTEWEVESTDHRLYRLFQKEDGWYIDGIYD